MRRRASLLVAAVFLLGATPAVADEKLQPYEATVSRDQAAVVADSGIELDHAGFKATALGA
jgi:isopentenyl diphosphate isomerase/L-lactate dehydrogenase-like FMN-dependent dehydrogenase